VGAAPTTPGRFGTARQAGPGKRDGEVYVCRNQWWNPLKEGTGSNLVDAGRAATHAVCWAPTLSVGFVRLLGGHGEGLRRSRGEVAGEELGTDPVERLVVNVGSLAGLPYPTVIQAAGGNICRLRMARRGDGGSVVVRGRESRPHGEGTQQVRSVVTGTPGGRR